MAISSTSQQGQALRPPFRADHVGSLLRPDKLKRAREQFLGAQTSDRNLGPHDSAPLRAVEDECIRGAIDMQERAGLELATDGEFRRHLHSIPLRPETPRHRGKMGKRA